MRNWPLPVALGLAAALVALAVVFQMGDGRPATAAARAAALAAELRCPDCQGLSVADSPTRSAREIRAQIDELIAAGASDEDVRAHFVARYGEWVRLAPSMPLVWLVPFLVVGVGAGGLLAWMGARRSATPQVGLTQLSEDERRRLHDEADALDA